MTRDPRRRPALVVRIASMLLPPRDRELLLGDLEDAYAARASLRSPARAAFQMLLEPRMPALSGGVRSHLHPQTEPKAWESCSRRFSRIFASAPAG